MGDHQAPGAIAAGIADDIAESDRQRIGAAWLFDDQQKLSVEVEMGQAKIFAVAIDQRLSQQQGCVGR